MAEQWICIIADMFVGTRPSRFTLNIQEERDLLGIPAASTWNHFCQDQSDQICYKPNWFDPFPECPQRTELLKDVLQTLSTNLANKNRKADSHLSPDDHRDHDEL